MVGNKSNIAGIPGSLLHLLIVLFPNLECAFSRNCEFSAETYHVDSDTWLPNLATRAHVFVQVLQNLFQPWLQIGCAMVLHTLEMLHILKEIYFSFSFLKYMMSKHVKA